jgi:hypothetical protein
MAEHGRWQATIVDSAGNIVPAASVEVREEEPGAALVQLYSDRDGMTPIGNPATADSDGFVYFHAAGGKYKITATSGTFTREWRYVPIGTATEYDFEALVDAVSAEVGDDFLELGRHTIWVPAAAMKPKTSNGAAAGTYDTAGGIPFVVLDFDTSTQEYAYFTVAMPKSWNGGTVTFQPFWTNAAGLTTQNVVWELTAVALRNDDALNGSFGTGQTSNDTWIAQNDLHIGPESSAITVGGTVADDNLVMFRVSRVVGSDNMTGDARLLGIKLYMTIDAGNDA